MDVCKGENLQCANQRMQSLGGEKRIGCDMTSRLLNGVKNPHKIGNISKPPSIDKCMEACKRQENANQISLALYPQQHNFFYQKHFCLVASHIL